MTVIDRLIQTAKAEVGYLEKASCADLDSKTKNAGNQNYTKYWRDIAPNCQGQPWCACFVTWCIAKTFGREWVKPLLLHDPFIYCPTLARLFPLHANPKAGDIVLFYRGSAFVHTGIVTKVCGDTFWTVEGNTASGHAIIANGGAVCEKRYQNSALPGTKFVRPDYAKTEEGLTMEQYEELKQEIRNLTETVKILAVELHDLKRPMIYNYVDENMPAWARKAVQWAMDIGILKGDGDALNLDDKDVRHLTMLHRMQNTKAAL